MPYFEPTSAPTPYWCPNCRAWYQQRSPAISCCVLHAPGDCCHANEDLVESKSFSSLAPRAVEPRCTTCNRPLWECRGVHSISHQVEFPSGKPPIIMSPTYGG